MPYSGKISYTQTRVVKPSPTVLKRNRLILGEDNKSITTPYKILRTQVLQRLVSNCWNSLAVTSPRSGEGKTLTAINLAISLANEVNHTVLLIDLDLHRPSVHKYFGFEVEWGLSDYLLRDKPLQNILLNPGADRLVILPGHTSIENSSELLSSPKMVQLVEELKTRYPSRLLIFDLPPLLSTDDAIAFSPYVDAALVVIEEGKTKKEELKQTIDLLQGINILGTVLNKSVARKQDYY